jgi:hypothetical protein
VPGLWDSHAARRLTPAALCEHVSLHAFQFQPPGPCCRRQTRKCLCEFTARHDAMSA